MLFHKLYHDCTANSLVCTLAIKIQFNFKLNDNIFRSMFSKTKGSRKLNPFRMEKLQITFVEKKDSRLFVENVSLY